MRDWEITATDTEPALTLRVAYIHSSEEAAQVAAARERALTKAESAPARMRNGLGGRYYKTREQIERRVDSAGPPSPRLPLSTSVLAAG